jgi:hypothetical protein
LYRGAKYANDHLDGVTIQQGDKPFCVFIDSVADGYATTYTAHTKEDGQPVDAVAVNNAVELPSGFEVDWNTHLQKSLIDPMEPLLETRFGKDAWQDVLYDHEQAGLTSFQ